MKSRKLILAALFSAFIFIFTAYIFHIPIGSGGGYIHFGDTVMFLAASMLPFPYAMAAGAIGAGFSDLVSGGAMWVPFTIIIKPLMALCFTAQGKEMLSHKRNRIAPILGGLICMAGYYVAEGLIYQNFFTPLVSIPAGLIQLFGSMVFYYILASIIDKRGLKGKI